MPFNTAPATSKLFPPTDLPGIAEGDWVEISVVYTGAMRQAARLRAIRGRFDADDIDYFEYKHAILEAIVVSWSDPEPPTPATIAALHPFVQDWITTQFYELANGRAEEEKKDSESTSSSGPEREEPSLVSSST